MVQLVSNRTLILYWGVGGLNVIRKKLQLWKFSFTGTEKRPVKSTGRLAKGTVPSAGDPHFTLASGQVSDFTCHPVQNQTAELHSSKKQSWGLKHKTPCFLARIPTPNYMVILFCTTVEQYLALRARVAFLSLLSLRSGTQFLLKNDTAHLLPVYEPGGEGVAAEEDRRLWWKQ